MTWVYHHDTPGELAEFVTPDAFLNSAIVTGLHGFRADGLAVAETIFDRLRVQNLRYDLPRALNRFQQPVASASELFQQRSDGTCLDLVLLLASAFRQARLRPFIAVFDSPVLGEPHALVLLHRDHRPGLKPKFPSGMPLWNVLNLPMPDDRARYGIFEINGVPLPGELIPIEATGLSCTRPLTFAEARKAGEDNLAGARLIRLVDVVFLQENGRRTPCFTERVDGPQDGLDFGEDVRLHYEPLLAPDLPATWDVPGLTRALHACGAGGAEKDMLRRYTLRALIHAALAKERLGTPEWPESVASLQRLYHAAIHRFPSGATIDRMLVEAAEAGIIHLKEGRPGVSPLISFTLALACQREVADPVALLRPLLRLLGYDALDLGELVRAYSERQTWLVVRCSPAPGRDPWPVRVTGSVYVRAGGRTVVDPLHDEDHLEFVAPAALHAWIVAAAQDNDVTALDLVLPTSLLDLGLEHLDIPGQRTTLAKVRQARLRWDLFDTESLPFARLLRARSNGRWQTAVQALPGSDALGAWLDARPNHPVFSFDRTTHQTTDLEAALMRGAGFLLGQPGAAPPRLAQRIRIPDETRREELPAHLRFRCDEPVIIWNNPLGRLGIPWPQGVCEAPGGMA